MKPEPAEAPTRSRRVMLALLLLLVGVNIAAVWSLWAARQSARRLAAEELERQTWAQGQALEAALARLRGDFILLSQSRSLASARQQLHLADPVARRWSRLEIEGALLLFLTAQPAVVELVLEDERGEVQLKAGRRNGAPILMPTEGHQALRSGSEQVVWPLGPEESPSGRLTASLDRQVLLAAVAPGFEKRLRLEPSAPVSPGWTGSNLEARVPVAGAGFTPPLSWTLIRTEEESRLVLSVESLTGRFGTAVLVNLLVLGFSYALALVALRQERRATLLAAENRHQARLRELERQVETSERLASVGRLAVGLAHEINNPLEGMSNYLRLAEEDLAAGETAEAARSAAKVRQGLERIAGITRQVLRFGNPQQAPKEMVELAPLVERAAELVRADPAARATRFSIELPRKGFTTRGNPIALEQLISNLILNACQAQREDGVVEVVGQLRGGSVVVRVADRGPGLSPDALARAFEPFFSTRGSTGLGLAVCRGIVEAHGGTIRAANRPEGGAVLEVELPRAAAEEGGET